MKRIALFLLLIICFEGGISQTFEWQASFFGITDNREYFNPIQYPQTIFGARGAFEAGLRFDEIQRIRFGINYLYEFGAQNEFEQNRAITMYYEYNKKPFKLMAGMFPRRGQIDYPLAMLTDTLLYYRPNMEGLLAEVRLKYLKQNLWVDWTGRQSEVIAEAFVWGTSGRISYGNLFFDDYIIGHHRSSNMVDKDATIRDNYGMSLGVGVDLSAKTILDTLSLSVNYLQSADRDRIDGIWHTPKGFYLNLKSSYKNFAINAISYFGESQRFAFGDAFYTAQNYTRIDLIYKLIKTQNVSAEFCWSLHIADGDKDNQQRLLILVNLGGERNIDHKWKELE